MGFGNMWSNVHQTGLMGGGPVMPSLSTDHVHPQLKGMVPTVLPGEGVMFAPHGGGLMGGGPVMPSLSTDHIHP